MAPFPNIAIDELHASLPIDQVDVGFAQTELRLTRGDPIACAPGVPSPLTAACAVTEVDFHNPVRTILWREADMMTTALFAEGATGMVYEDISGETAYGGTYLYQLTSWKYHSEADAAASSILSLVAACGADHASVAGTPALQLSEDGDPYLLALQVGEHVYVIESRDGTDEDGTRHPLRDTTTGRLPAAALRVIATWWAEHGTIPDDAVVTA